MNLALSALTSLALGLGLSTTLPRINSNVNVGSNTTGAVNLRTPRLQTNVNGDGQLSTSLRIRPGINANLGANTHANANTSANTQTQGTAAVNANGNAQAQTNAQASTEASANAQTEANANVEGDVILDVRLSQLSLDVSGEAKTESDAFISIGL